MTLGGAPSGAFADAAIGNGKAVTVSGSSISGADTGDYSFTQQQGLTADITSAALNPAVNTVHYSDIPTPAALAAAAAPLLASAPDQPSSPLPSLDQEAPWLDDALHVPLASCTYTGGTLICQSYNGN